MILYEDSYRNIAIAVSGGNAAEMLHASAEQTVKISVEQV